MEKININGNSLLTGFNDCGCGSCPPPQKKKPKPALLYWLMHIVRLINFHVEIHAQEQHE